VVFGRPHNNKNKNTAIEPLTLVLWWYLAVHTTIKIKIQQSNCWHWFYLVSWLVGLFLLGA
jgi:hypothetical protein